nr:AAA family ATPase [Aminobacterium mobile]
MLSLREIGLSADDIRAWFEREIHPKNVKVDGDQIYCSCPIQSHNHKNGDKTPSFSLNIADGCWYCHSTGDSGSIKKLCELCGVQAPWHGKGKTPSKETVYPYHDASGKLIYEVVRTDDPSGKKIFQRAILPNGEKRNSMKGVKRVPFHLPEILKAQAGNQTIFVVEGEKCVEALRALGLVATTNSGGAGKWNDCGQYFQKGISVIIIPDNDEPGRKHALEVAQDLQKRGCNVKILNLPNLQQKEDVFDWLKKGHGKEELLELVGRCEEWDEEPLQTELQTQIETNPSSIQESVQKKCKELFDEGFGLELARETIRAELVNLQLDGETTFLIEETINKSWVEFLREKPADKIISAISASDLMKMVIPAPEWAVQNMIPAGLSVLASPPKVGKSFFCLQLALAVATGQPFLDHRTEKGSVLYISLEDSPYSLQKRLSYFLEDHRKIPNNLFLTNELPQLDAQGLLLLDQWLATHNDARLVIIDTWGKTKPNGNRQKNAYESDVELVSPIKKLADRYSTSILLVHHLKKGGGKESDWLESLSGSMGLAATVDGLLSLYRDRGAQQGILKRTGRNLEEDDDIGLEWTAPGWRFAGDAREVLLSESRKEIVAAIKEIGEPATPTMISEMSGKKIGTIKPLLRRMLKDGILNCSSQGRYFLPLTSDSYGCVEETQPMQPNNPVAPVAFGSRECNPINPSDSKGLQGTVARVAPVAPVVPSVGNLLEIFPDGFKSRKCTSLDKFLSTIQEKKGDDRMENSQPKKLEPWKPEQKLSQPSIPKSPPTDWRAWLESSEPAVKEKYDEVFNRLKVFLTEENARQKAFERSWDLQQKLKEEAA